MILITMDNGLENTVVEVRKNGLEVKLFDGSNWSINPDDSVKTAEWYPSQRIIIEKSDNERYPFVIINLDTFPQDQVGAARI
jgi:hypothetical protein